jgi:hypothetical protein
MTRVSIVIPALDEALNLEIVLPQLPQVHEVIVIDGGSEDNTTEVVRRRLPNAVILHQSRRGKGNALALGFEHVTGDVVVMFDADGSADPCEIPRFVEAIEAGAEFVKGTRIRKFGARALTWVMNRLYGTQHTDLCYGYNAFRADLIPSLGLPDPYAKGATQWGDGFEIETLLNCRMAMLGAVTVEVPSVERLRLFGASHLHAVKDGLRVLHTLRAERKNDGFKPMTQAAADRAFFTIAMQHTTHPSAVIGPLDMENFRAPGPNGAHDEQDEGSTP